MREKKGDKCYYGSKTDKNIGVEGARMISEALRINGTLAELNLSCDRKKKRIKKIIEKGKKEDKIN